VGMQSVLSNRGVIKIIGKDVEIFLQGLITNDIRKASKDSFLYSMMLNPQGRFLYDFFILKINDGFLLDCPQNYLQEIIKKFQMYKLRSEVDIFETGYSVSASDVVLDGFFIDPRNSNMGYRTIAEVFRDTDSREYEIKRIKNLVPDADKDFIYNKSFPLEYGANNLNAIDYKKGCYVGQEVTARTNYRGVVRKKLFSFESDIVIDKESEIKVGDNKIGIVLGMFENLGLCLLNIEEYEKFSISKSDFLVGDYKVTINNDPV
jgi:folate-binding protein YgfZ